MRISTKYHGDYIGSDGTRVRRERWSAIDSDTYDVDHNGVDFVSTSPMGWGESEDAAIKDLIEQIQLLYLAESMVVNIELEEQE